MTTYTTKNWKPTSNYVNMINDDPDEVIIINKIDLPDGIHVGYPLFLEFNNDNKGAGIFIKNKTADDADGNLRLECWERQIVGGMLLSKVAAGHNFNYWMYNAVLKLAGAVVAWKAGNDPLYGTELSDFNVDINHAKDDCFIENMPDPISMVNSGAFAYGVGGGEFVNGIAVKDTKGGVDYYDYSSRPPMVLLLWDGTMWQQVTPLSLNAIS